MPLWTLEKKISIHSKIKCRLDYVDEEDIIIMNDRIILKIPNATLSNYKDTGSMGPFLNGDANGIRVVPSSEEDINVGDIISGDDWEMKFDFCYPSCTNNPDNCDDLTTDAADTTFSLADHTGKVFMIEMSATWWGPCVLAIPEGDEIYEYWEEDDRVEIIHALDDLGQGFNCAQWGNMGVIGIPPIVDDGILYPFRDLSFPNYAFALEKN